MHELSLCKSILEVAHKNALKISITRIKSISIEVGELSCVDKSLLKFGFEALSKGTIAENAVLIIIEIKAKSWCQACQKAICVSQFYEQCSECGSMTGDILQGSELMIKSMEVE